MKQIFILKEPENQINSPEEIFKNIKEIKINYNQENFIIICLDTKNKILKMEVLFKGGLNACLIDIKTLFRSALIENSCKVIIAHNHPSNSLKPSDEDKDIFKKLVEAGDILDLKVLDSIIFNKKEFYSLNSENNL